jgi:hypothetical protein
MDIPKDEEEYFIQPEDEDEDDFYEDPGDE